MPEANVRRWGMGYPGPVGRDDSWAKRRARLNAIAVPNRMEPGLLVVEHGHRFEGLAFEHLKRRATTGRHMADPVGIAELLDRRG